jgi:hypothetical protein
MAQEVLVKTRRRNCPIVITTAALTAAGLASVASAAPSSKPEAGNQPFSTHQEVPVANDAVLLDSGITGGVRPRASGLNCQEQVLTPGTGQGSRNYTPAFRVADNFKPAASGTITSVTWNAIYRSGAGTTASPFVNQPPPAAESFLIRILSNDGPFQTPFPAGPLTPTSGLPNAVGGGVLFTTTVTNPPRIATGQTTGTVTPLSVYEYTATIAGPAVTAGTCYWLEITNNSPDIVTPNPAGMVSFWMLGGGGGGQTGDIYSYQASNPPANAATPYTPFNQLPEDRAFCINLTLTDLISNSCPITGIPPICNNPPANGQGISNAAGTGFNAAATGSVNGAAPNNPGRFERAENFTISGTGTATISSMCFWGFWVGYTAGTFPPTPADLSRFQITYYQGNLGSGLPGTVIASFTGAQVTVITDNTALFSISHPAVNVTRGQCTWVNVSYRDDFNNTNANARFIWGAIRSAADNAVPPAPFDNRFASRSQPGTATGVPGAWVATAIPFGQANHGIINLSYAFDAAGPYVLGTCLLSTPANSTCATATALAVPGTVSSWNTNSVAAPLPSCGFDLIEGPVSWHTVAGNGQNVTINLSQPSGQQADLILSVYCATSCSGPFTCVTGNNIGDLVVGTTSVTFFSAPGQTYYVAISGFGGTSTGQYTLTSTTAAGTGTPPTCASLVRCQLDADPADVTEAEVCRADQNGSANPDCATATNISLGQSGKGFMSTFLNTGTNAQNRDIDFWTLPTFATPTWIDIVVNSEFPALFQVLNYATACTDTATVVPNSTFTSAICVGSTTRLVQVLVPAGGINRFLITAPSFNGLPCSSGNNAYIIRFSASPTGACCTGTSCSTQVETACLATVGNTFSGDGTVCSSNPCGAPSTGACCLGVGCTVTTAAACTGAVGTATNNFKGVGTVCNAPGTPPFTNNLTPCCRADFNQDGTRAPTDIFNFLTNYFNATPAVKATTDTNGNGTQEPTDIFNFLTVYFAAGC